LVKISFYRWKFLRRRLASAWIFSPERPPAPFPHSGRLSEGIESEQPEIFGREAKLPVKMSRSLPHGCLPLLLNLRQGKAP
jgi:hypothetical protein